MIGSVGLSTRPYEPMMRRPSNSVASCIPSGGSATTVATRWVGNQSKSAAVLNKCIGGSARRLPRCYQHRTVRLPLLVPLGYDAGVRSCVQRPKSAPCVFRGSQSGLYRHPDRADRYRVNLNQIGRTAVTDNERINLSVGAGRQRHCEALDKVLASAVACSARSKSFRIVTLFAMSVAVGCSVWSTMPNRCRHSVMIWAAVVILNLNHGGPRRRP